MTPPELLVFFFIFVLAMFSVAAYVFVLRPAQSEASAPRIPC